MEEIYTHGLNYDLIKRAVGGDNKALEDIIHIYEPFHNSLVTENIMGDDGEYHCEFNEDWKVIIQMKLINSIKKWRKLI